MAARELKFAKNERGLFEASFASEGAVTIQLERKSAGFLYVHANLEGMERRSIGGFNSYSGGENLIFAVDVPAGVQVTLESETEVLTGKMAANG